MRLERESVAGSPPSWPFLWRLRLFLTPGPPARIPTRGRRSPNSLLQGLQPIKGQVPVATPAPGESQVFSAPTAAYQAIPEVRGRTKIFHIVERAAPWTLKPGLTVLANTYNGVVPGPVLVVESRATTVVIDYRNDDATPDTIHLHGIRGAPDTMDGVPGISQALVPTGGSYRYTFVASQAGTFIYHTHGQESMLELRACMAR